MRWSEMESSGPSSILMIVIFFAASGAGGVIGLFCREWGPATLRGAVAGAMIAAIGLSLFGVGLTDNTAGIAVAAGCCAYSAFDESRK